MAWQPEVGSGTDRATDSKDFLTKLVQFSCSKHVATVAVNNGGTATYVVGDIMTLTHASAHLDARFEVTSVSTGVITGLRIVASGAFAQQAVSATVSAGGSGYQVGDILWVSGGSSRMPAKFEVATLSGSAVATVTLYEGGGVYATTPSNPAATVGVGNDVPATYAGDDACTLTVTYQALLTPLTAVAITGGSGGGSPTVDITFAETGWAVDGRDHNDWADDDRALGNEKQVTLVGDATGFTNKPYAHFATGATASGLNWRHWLEVWGSVAHNSGLTIDNQPGIGAGYVSDGGSFLLFPQNVANDVDFWFSVDDLRVMAFMNENPSASTDNGRYMSLYVGFMDRAKTETEDPFPAIQFASGRDRDGDPGVSSAQITSMAECRASSSGPAWYYIAELPGWVQLKSNDTGSVGTRTDTIWPFGEPPRESGSFNLDFIVGDSPIMLNDGVILRNRASSSRVLRPTPGTTDLYFLFPLVVIRRLNPTPSEGTDSIRGQLRGTFWLYNDDGSGSAITNFSEDYITIGTDRYRIFHNHAQTERYQYMAVKEDV